MKNTLLGFLLAIAAVAVMGQVSQPPVPSGVVAFYATTSTCPSGWSEYTAARGRYITGLPLAGTLAGTDGTALTNLEDRPTGQHNHTASGSSSAPTVNDPGHTHTVPNNVTISGGGGSAVENAGTAGSYSLNEATTSSTTGVTVNAPTISVTVNNTGSTTGTNAPYVQLLACKKN